MRLTGSYLAGNKLKKSFIFLHSDITSMRKSTLKSFMFFQSSLLGDRIFLQHLVPSDFKIDFAKNTLYQQLVQENLLIGTKLLKSIELVGNSALLFSSTFDFKKLLLLKTFYLNAASAICFFTVYKGFILNGNRLTKLSELSSYSSLSISLITALNQHVRNLIFVNKFVVYLRLFLFLTWFLLVKQLFLCVKFNNFLNLKLV